MQAFEFYWVLMLCTPGHGWNQTYDLWTKGRDYKEGQVDRKKRKVFATAYVVLRTAAVFLASGSHHLNRGSHPPGKMKRGQLIPGENTSV